MFNRVYPIRLRSGVTRERIEELHAVLRAAPNHIPGFVESELFAAGEDGGHDLVWRNVFESEDAFWLYAGHPYHANLINDYLAPDAPGSVKASSSTGITWSDDRPIDPLEVLDRETEDSAHAAPAGGLHRADAALARAGISAPVVFLLEQIEVVPGKTGEYLDAVREVYLPAAHRHGMRLLMSWQSPPDTGEHELTFLWSVDGWGAAFRSFVAISQEVDVMDLWLDNVRPLRAGGRRRYLLPTGLPGDWAQ